MDEKNKNAAIETAEKEDLKEVIRMYLQLSREDKLKAFGVLIGLNMTPQPQKSA